ncbi:MAG: glycosyl transferase family 1 [Bdellovibrionales bacterium CG12_big_fil_rev_8_21_14_0_65_38_15]|nr:MAG: glycosyl transferase family 1 [Bdellovibrionales bacterium CG22_combo_CG10-13_8_21_14_all_38_13]PIQ53282.1 MAG: glycosyl transferase family 1 [Bdellovibrionales bacterium CG12_big_fil_rev_8_21_14_0_65_38_15]PIR30357.1 MAG: glycosyl transferase family 1 [Bdellovibrionales bacterium CG11_big_fil_rev_8_21_14_0_20_38_13]
MSLSFSNVTKIQTGQALFTGATFQINPGEKVGLVGPNGAGKTSLFRLITGEDRPDEGQVSTSEGLRISYFSQNVGEMAGRSALQEVIEGDAKVSVLKKKLTEYEDKLSDPNLDPDEMNAILEKMGDVQTEYEKIGGYDLDSRAEEVLTGLGIAPKDHHRAVESFSGGWKMRIALAKVLVTVPDLIVMDEPTNYLDLETILWLEKWLQLFKGAVFMTTHDRDFMNNVAKKIIEIAHRKITVYSGDYNFYEKERDIRRTQLEAEHSRQRDMLAKEEEFIAKFKARASHAAQVQSRVKKLEKIDRVELPPEEQTISFDFPVPPRGSDDVVVMENLAKTWKTDEGDLKVFEGLSAMVARQEKIAVVGVNGAGKSTLLKVICGQTEPTAGQVSIGPSIKVGYFSQYSLEVLDPEATVSDEVRSRLPNVSDGYLRNLLAAFLFRGDDVKKKVRHLSGGEKSRLVLAYLFSQGNNLLVLDEPTNHLDIISRGILMDALKAYEGTLLFVSHDRYFLHALGSKVMEVDKGGVTLWPGNYSWYLEKKGLA